ncbi:MAG: hypothetical protein ABR555_11985 [Pyrinomonadaceae bacterium]
MKSHYLRSRIGAAVFVISLLVGIGLTANLTAQAQYQTDPYYRRDRDRNRDQRRDRDYDRYGRRRSNDGYSNLGGSPELRQTALNAGFNEGTKAGREDRRRGRQFEPQNWGLFQKATKDYSSRLGDRELYRRYFREAFEHGYNDGFSGY